MSVRIWQVLFKSINFLSSKNFLKGEGSWTFNFDSFSRDFLFMKIIKFCFYFMISYSLRFHWSIKCFFILDQNLYRSTKYRWRFLISERFSLKEYSAKNYMSIFKKFWIWPSFKSTKAKYVRYWNRLSNLFNFYYLNCISSTFNSFRPEKKFLAITQFCL